MSATHQFERQVLKGVICCRGTLLPDPRYDALRGIVLAAADDAEDMSDGNYTARVLLFHEKTTKLREGLPNVQVHMHASFTGSHGVCGAYSMETYPFMLGIACMRCQLDHKAFPLRL